MDTIDFKCPQCSAAVHAPRRLAGKRAKCARCGSSIEVPAPDDPVAEAAEPEPEEPSARPATSRRSSPGRRAAARDDVDHAAPSTARNDTAGLLGAIGAAVVGAVAWAAVLAGAHYEIGWLAWGIGAGIGAACVALGGRGTGLAVTCAVLAVVSIAAGKYAGYAVGAQGISEAAVRDHVSRDWYDEYARDAEGWAALGDDPTDQQIREYLVMHDWVETTDPAEIDAESVTEFASTEGPGLREFHRQQPTFDAWRDQVARDMANLVTESVSPTDAIIEDVNAFDLLFVFLGVSTAFGIVYKRSEQDAQASRRAARQAARAESAES